MTGNEPSIMQDFKEAAEAVSGLGMAFSGVTLPFTLIQHTLGHSTPLIASVSAFVVCGIVFGSIVAWDKSASQQNQEPKPKL